MKKLEKGANAYFTTLLKIYNGAFLWKFSGISRYMLYVSAEKERHDRYLAEF